jgi:hypothetical protein
MRYLKRSDTENPLLGVLVVELGFGPQLSSRQCCVHASLDQLETQPLKSLLGYSNGYIYR